MGKRLLSKVSNNMFFVISYHFIKLLEYSTHLACSRLHPTIFHVQIRRYEYTWSHCLFTLQLKFPTLIDFFEHYSVPGLPTLSPLLLLVLFRYLLNINIFSFCRSAMPRRYILTTQLNIVTILNSHQIFMTLNSMLHVRGFSNQLISEDNSRWLEGSNSWTYKT